MAKQKKPAAVMARPNSTWFQNALKSVGAVSGDIIKDLMPYTSASADSVMGVARDVRNTIRKSASSGRSVTGQLEKNNLIQMGRKALHNAAEDLKSGKLYNTDRDIDFGGDFNFDDIDMSFGDFDEADDSGYGDNTVINNINTVDSGAVLAVRDSVDKQTNATIAGATATVNTMVAVSSNMMMANQKNMSEVLSHLSSIDTNIASMITYMNENVTKFIEASIAHYQEVAPQKVDNNISSSSDDKATSATIFGSSGFNASEYVKYVKQNISNSTVGGFYGMLKDLAPMLMGGVVSNPIGTIAKAVGKNMISKDFKKSLKAFDDTLQSFLPTMLERLSEKAFDYADDGAKGTLMRTLGSIFGVRTPVKNEFARKKYESGPTPFDNETKLAITEVIPSYLRDILAEISGKEKQVFDKQEMKFRNISELQNEIYGDIYDTVIRTFKSSDVGKKLNNRQSRLDIDDQSKFEDLVNRLYLGLSRSSGEIDPRTLGSDESLVKYLAGGDASALNKMKRDYGPILSYLTEALNSLTEGEKSGLNFTKIRARQNREARKREMEAAPELYNLNLTNDGITIDQGMNEYHKRAYTDKKNATVVGTSTSRRYNPRTMMEDIASIKSILYRGINVKVVDNLGPLDNGGNHPSGGNTGGDNTPNPVGHSVEAARRDIAEEEELSAELAQYSDNRGGAPTRTVNTITNFMQAMINGGPSAASDVISQAVMSGFSKAESWLSEHVLNPISKVIFGDKDKGEDNKGIFGGIKDSFSDMINGALHSLTGKGYTKKNPAAGEDAVVADSEDSLAHKAKKLFNNIKEGAAEYLFGKKNEETGKRDGGFIGSMKQKLSDGLEGWSETIFGKSKEGEPTPGEKMKGYMKKAIPSALGGGAIGTMISSLMGGSVLGNAIAPGVGGLIGSAIGMVSKSEKFKNWLFGHEDKDGRYIKGVLSKKTQETLKESKNMILGGGALGLLKGLILPSAAGATGAGLLTSFVGGPVAGMLMGAGLGMVKKSKWFQEMMYGKDGPDGKHINGIKDKIKNFFSKSGGKKGGAGGGYKGGMALLGGAAGAGLGKLLLSSGIGTSMGLFGAATMPILGGVMGAGLGILNSSEKFKKMMFGDIDEETGKRKGNGLVGKLGMWMNVNIMEPMKYGAEYVKTKMVFAGKRMLKGFSDMLDPLKTRINQIKDSIIDKLTDFRRGITGVVKTAIVKPLKKAGEVMMVPLRFIGKQGAKLGTALLKAPMDALSLVFKTMTKGLNLKNIKGFIKDGWKHAKNAIGDTIKRGGKWLFQNTFGQLVSTVKKHIGNESKFGKWVHKWLSPVQKALVDGAKGIFKWITGGIKKILGLPFKALGWAISAPFKLLGKAVGAVGKVARTGAGLLGVAMNAKESDKDGNAVGPGMRDKLKTSLDEKAQEWAKRTGRDASEYGGPRKWLDTLKLLDPGYARLDTARRNGEIRDTVTITDKNGKTHEKKLNAAIDEQDALSKEAERLSIERLKEKYHLGESRKNAKRFKYDPTKKEEILGEDRVYEGITAKGVANIDAKIADVEAKQQAIADAISGSSEKQVEALNEGNATSAEIADVVRRGGEPGSIYTHDVHGEGILQSIYTFLVRRFSGATVSADDLDKISNPHLNNGIVTDVTDGIFEDVESMGEQGAVSAELSTPSGSESMEEALKSISPWDLAASGANSDTMESFINGDDAVLAVQNSELRLKDEEEDKERNEKQAAEAQAGLEKAQTDAKRLREEAAKKEADDSDNQQKQTGLLKSLLLTTKEHTKSWFQTFDLKKGVITAGIIALAPVALKLIGSLANGTLFSGFLSDVVGSVQTTIGNIFSNLASNGGIEGVAQGVGDLGSRAVELVQGNTDWMRNSNGDIDNVGTSVGRYFTKNTFKLTNNVIAGFTKTSGIAAKQTAKIAEKTGAKKVLAKIGTTTTKSLAGTGGFTKAIGGVTKKIGELIGTFTKWLAKKFPKVGSKVAQKISGKLGGEVVEKIAVKGGAKIIGAATAKTVTAAVSFGASELVWAILGGVDGAIKAAQLFEVREQDVDASMRAISITFCALLGTTVGTVIDIVASVAEAIIGTNFIHEAAQLIWSLGKSEEDKQFYQNQKEAFKDDWRQEAYKKYKEQAGDDAMSLGAFLESDDATIANLSGMSLSDYNQSTNKDMWGHIGSFFQGIGDGISNLFQGSVKNNAKAMADTFGVQYTSESLDAAMTEMFGTQNGSGSSAVIDTKWAGGVVRGNGPRLTLLSPGEIVYNPAGPQERQEQRKREEAARDMIYSNLSINANADELGTVSVDSSISNAQKSPGYKLLEGISTGMSDAADRLLSIKNILYGMYSSMIGSDAFSLSSESDIKSASKSSKGILVDSISNIEDAISSVMMKLGLAKKKVKVKNANGEYVWVDESQAANYQNTSGSGRGSADSDKEVGSETTKVGNARLYQQEDPTWNQSKYKNLDIFDSGCGPTAAAIAASVYGSSMNPVTAANIVNNSGYRDIDGGTDPQGIHEVGKYAGVDMVEGTVSSPNIINSLEAGRPVILMGQDNYGRGGSVYGDGMHYVVGTGYDPRTGNVRILDPLNNRPKTRKLRDFIGDTKAAIYTGASKKSRRGKGSRKFGKGESSNLSKEFQNSAQFRDAKARSIIYTGTLPHSAPYRKSGLISIPIYTGQSYLDMLSYANVPIQDHDFHAVFENYSGYEWVKQLDDFWRESLDTYTYSQVRKMAKKVDGFEPVWIPIDVMKDYYGATDDDWKNYYLDMAYNYLGEHAPKSYVDTSKMDASEIDQSVVNTDPSKDIYIDELLTKLKSMPFESDPKDTHSDDDILWVFDQDRMKSFINIEFGTTANVLKMYCLDPKIRMWVYPMMNYCNRMDNKIIAFVTTHAEDVKTWITNNINSFLAVVGSSGFTITDFTLRKKLFNILTNSRLGNSELEYMCKHYEYLMHSNAAFKSFISVVDFATSVDMKTNIPGYTYLKGESLTITGNIAQCDVVRRALLMLSAITYSTSNRHGVDGKSGDSASSISDVYSEVLPIPDTGIAMYCSGKAQTIFASVDVESSSDDSELLEKLYAGDILLYRSVNDPINTSIRHVEMYAGDGIMLGHSGGTNGNVKGFHAAPFSSAPGDLRLFSVRRFIKMENTILHTITFNIDDMSYTLDGEDSESMKTSFFDKVTGFLSEVASRMWNGLMTGEWDWDYSDFWASQGTFDNPNAEYANNSADKTLASSYLDLESVRRDQYNQSQLASKLQGIDNEYTDYYGPSDDYEKFVQAKAIDNSLTFSEWKERQESKAESNVIHIAGRARGRKKTKGKIRGRGRYGRGNSYTPDGQTTVLPKGLGWYTVNEGWGAITAQSPQLDLKNRAQRNQSSLYDSDGYGKYGDRYVVATTRTFGEPGDYIDIEQSDGNVIPAVIGDIKAWGVNTLEGRHVNKWGHNDGDVVLEFLKNSSAKSFSTNPSDYGDPMYSTLHGKTVASITNRGSALLGADPIAASGKISQMSYSASKHSGTDGSNTLSPLSEGYEEWAAANGVSYGNTCPSGESVYSNPDAIYKSAPRPSGMSAYAGAELASNSGYTSSGTSTSGETETAEDNSALTIIQNAMNATMSRLSDYMFNGGELKPLTEEEIRNGSAASTVNTDRYYTYTEDTSVLPDSLVTANDEYGKEVASENAEKTKSNRKALYDPTIYTSKLRADGWFLGNMPYSSKTSSFGEDYIMSDGSHLWTPCHKGIDIAAGTGTEIYSPVDGTVSAVVPESSGSGFGNYVTIIDDKKKYHHIFAHQSKFANGIGVGTKVKRGELVGYVGSTGYSTGPHLHYQIDASSQNGSYINPNSFPFSIYDSNSTGDINDTEHYETSNIDASKGGRGVKDPLAIYKTLRQTMDESKVQAQRSKRDRASEAFNKAYGKGGDGGSISTARLESLTETMIDILNTIADNTLSSSEKLDNIKTSAINMNLPKTSGNSTKPSKSNSANSPSNGVMSTNERFARQIARGI